MAPALLSTMYIISIKGHQKLLPWTPFHHSSWMMLLL